MDCVVYYIYSGFDGDELMPFESWQFWLVTFIVFLAVYALIRPFISRGKKNATCCGGSAKPKKTKLTISKKSPRP